MRAAAGPADTTIQPPIALGTWALAWLGGNIASAVVVLALGYGGDDTSMVPIWVLFLGTAVVWTAFLVGMAIASQRAGTGNFVRDYRVRARPIDLIGAPIGVLTQLVLVPLVYVPLEALWEGTFNDDKLSKNAQDLADRAGGFSMILLVLMVCVCAPLIEELVYRGLLQGSFATRFQRVPAVVAAAAIFTIIHFRPVEYPGLFVVGLVLGGCAILTGRLGMAMACHIGFNITGLLLAFN